MNKTELITHIAQRCDLSNQQAEQTVAAFLEGITSAIAKGDTVSLIGFGSLGVKARPARTGRNPKTGQPLQIPASKTVYFKAGSKLKEAVNRP